MGVNKANDVYHGFGGKKLTLRISQNYLGHTKGCLDCILETIPLDHEIYSVAYDKYLWSEI